MNRGHLQLVIDALPDLLQYLLAWLEKFFLIEIIQHNDHEQDLLIIRDIIVI